MLDAKARFDAQSQGDWQVEVSDTNNGAYSAKYTVVSRDDIVLRLYRTGDATLLAERTFREHGVEIHWTDDELICDTSADDGAIHLPPTPLDRLLARLP